MTQVTYQAGVDQNLAQHSRQLDLYVPRSVRCSIMAARRGFWGPVAEKSVQMSPIRCVGPAGH